MATPRFCSCRKCRRGRDRKRGQVTIINAKRAARHKNKMFLKTGEYDRVIDRYSVPYTD